ncbi:hypothetical protein NIES2101_23745 [Calothrix sp. HK-06]|nr:hypothetical protein NIES2101_23745 [Calothrix sp. HK-06]
MLDETLLINANGASLDGMAPYIGTYLFTITLKQEFKRIQEEAQVSVAKINKGRHYLYRRPQYTRCKIF